MFLNILLIRCDLISQDYSWDDHGYPFLNTLYSEIGPMMDEKFKLAFQMTYRT